MRLTNKHKLPQAIVNLVTSRPNPHHPDNRVSVSELLAPVQISILSRRHYDSIIEDAMDRVWLLFGTFAHYVLEKNAPLDAIAEEKKVVEFNGCMISGIADIFHEQRIDDYKTTTVCSDILDKS